MTIKGLIFDFDGLILDTETPLLRSWEVILGEYGLSVSIEEWASQLGTSADHPSGFDMIERHLDEPINREVIDARRSQHELELIAMEEILPGVVEILTEAKDRGLRLGLASSSSRSWVIGHLVRLNLESCFESIRSADDVSHTKPFPDLYLAVLQDLGLQAHQVIAFEDSRHGVRAAKRAGIFCVAVPNPITRYVAIPEADLTVKALSEMTLEAYIRKAEG
jgi:HAD superfamily hydrolase (TIGR01509 family)